MQINWAHLPENPYICRGRMLLRTFCMAALVGMTGLAAAAQTDKQWLPGYQGPAGKGLRVAVAVYRGTGLLPSDFLVAQVTWPETLSPGFIFDDDPQEQIKALHDHFAVAVPAQANIETPFGPQTIGRNWAERLNTLGDACTAPSVQDPVGCMVAKAYRDVDLAAFMPDIIFTVSAMVDHSETADGDDPMARLLSMGYGDVDNSTYDPLVELETDARCSRNGGALLCAACQGSFTAMAQGEPFDKCSDGIPGSAQYVIEMRTTFETFFFGPAARSMIDFQSDPRLAFMFQRSSGKTYSIQYVFHGMYEALSEAALR